MEQPQQPAQSNDHAAFQPGDPEAASRYADLLDMAGNLMLMYHALIEQGFTEGQALTLVGMALGGQR